MVYQASFDPALVFLWLICNQPLDIEEIVYGGIGMQFQSCVTIWRPENPDTPIEWLRDKLT